MHRSLLELARIPVKANRIQCSIALGRECTRQALFGTIVLTALVFYPQGQRSIMIGRGHVAVAVCLLECRQVLQPTLPEAGVRVPNETHLVQEGLALVR